MLVLCYNPSMADTETFTCKDRKIRSGEKVKITNSETGEVDFYRMEKAWGSYAIMRRISAKAAGLTPTPITIQRRIER